MMVCGKLRARLRVVSSHGDTVTRKKEIAIVDYKSSSTNTISVTMMELISWPQQGLPHPTAITSLIDKVTHILMKCPSKKIVVRKTEVYPCSHQSLYYSDGAV